MKTWNIEVNDEYYHRAIDCSNYNAILILYDIDTRDSYDLLYRLYIFFDFHYKYPYDKTRMYERNNSLEGLLNDAAAMKNNKYVNKKPEFFRAIFDPKIKFKEQNFYGSHHVEKEYIDILRYNAIRRNIYFTFYEISKNIDKRKKTFFVNRRSTIEDIKNAFSKNKIEFSRLNGFDWDYLTLAIDHDAPLDVIKYIITLYQKHHHNSFNYFVEADNRYINDKIRNIRYQTPLFKAISKKRFDIAETLIINGADINYEVNGMDPSYVYTSDFINKEVLNFLFKHGYKKPNILLKKCLYNRTFDNFREVYFDMIIEHYEKNGFKKEKLIDELLNDFKERKVDYCSSSRIFFDLVIQNEKDEEKRKLYQDKLIKKNGKKKGKWGIDDVIQFFRWWQ